jgi:hypothetical protein
MTTAGQCFAVLHGVPYQCRTHLLRYNDAVSLLAALIVASPVGTLLC